MTSSSEQFKIPVIKLVLVSMCILAFLAIPAGAAASDGVSNRGVTTTTAFTRHWSAPAFGFILYSGQLAYDQTSGCKYATGSEQLILIRALELPDGARITRIEFSGLDDISHNSYFELVVTNLFNEVVGYNSVISSGAAGNGVWGVDVDITVDNYDRYYYIDWESNGADGAGLTFCGAIITYELPGTLVSLPLVTK